MLNIGGAELLIILLVALVFLGPGRLPEVARQVGQTVSTLRGLARSFQTELEAAARPDTPPAVQAVGERNDALAAKAREQSARGDDARPVSDGGPTAPDTADEEE